MSLSTNVSDLAIRVGTELKSHKTLINGNAPDLTSLSTTAKANLVAAINELYAAIATAAGIDDSSTSTTTTWSSSKTRGEIDTASTADRARGNHTGTESADVLTDGTTNKAYTASERSKLAGIQSGATANATDASLRNFALSTGQRDHTAINNFDSQVDSRIELRVAGAPAALDTLDELAAAIGDDPNYAATITAALGNRVRVDAAQSLSGPQQTQARSNIAAASAADLSALAVGVGPVDTNYVQALEAALI